VSGDIGDRVRERVDLLESQFDDDYLEAVVKAGGLATKAQERRAR
jgi:hypothetical protein